MKKKLTKKAAPKSAAKPKAAPKSAPPKAAPHKSNNTSHVTPAVAQADAQSDASERMSRKRGLTSTNAALAVMKRHADLRDRSRRWSDLHNDPKTRAKMDELLNGLTPREARTVVLNGQRMACGMAPKDFS